MSALSSICRHLLGVLRTGELCGGAGNLPRQLEQVYCCESSLNIDKERMRNAVSSYSKNSFPWAFSRTLSSKDCGGGFSGGSKGTEEDLLPKDYIVNKWVYTELAFLGKLFPKQILKIFSRGKLQHVLGPGLS